MATILSSALNLTANLVGAGILSLPWALSQAGVSLGLLLLTLVMGLSMASFCIIGICCKRTGMFNYRAMVRKHVGEGAADCVQICNIGYACGSCISYVVLMADFLTGDKGAIQAWWPDTIFSDRSTTIVCCGLFVLLPLCLLPALDNLKYASAFTIVIKIVWTVWLCRAAWSQQDPVDSGAPTNWGGNPTSWYLAIPVLNVAYCAHYNAPRYYEELVNRSVERFRTVVIIAGILTTVSYVLSAVSGYYLFGGNVQGNVMNNVGRDLWLARVGYAIVVVFTFPLAHHSVRTGILALAGRDPNKTDATWTMLTVVNVVILLGLSTGITAVQKVLEFKGAVFGSTIVFVFPPWLLLTIRRRAEADALLEVRSNPWVNRGLVLMILWGCGTFAAGVAIAAGQL